MTDHKTAADADLNSKEQLLGSVFSTLKDKPTEEDIYYAATEEENVLYDGAILTSRSEILAWYLYDFANSPMFNVMTSLIIPLFLSDLAIHYGCEHESMYGCDYDNNLIGSNNKLIVYIFGIAVAPESFTFTMISISGGLQLISYLLIGAIGDYSYYQYYLFRICALIASVMIIVFVFLSHPKHYLFAGWWIAIQLVFFGLSIIFYNAYLPQMVENHWFVRGGIRARQNPDDLIKVKQRLSDDLSQLGYVIGYCGGLLMIIISVIVLVFMSETQYQQYTDFGITNGNNIQSFNEEWLKSVYKVDMSFDTQHLLSIQLFYRYGDTDMSGNIYGDDTLETTHSFEIIDDKYITNIEYWYNDDESIHSLRFTTQNGDISSIYGNATGTSDESMSGDSDNFIFAGYKVYKDRDSNIITGMDTIMLNEDTGQFPSTLPLRIVILLVCIWWTCFQLLSFKYMKRRDGPPLPEHNSNPLTFSIKTFYNTFTQAAEYRHLFGYLLSWFLFSDGLNTFGTASVLFARIELDFTAADSAFLLLEVIFLGSLGGVLFLWLQRKLGWDAKQMVILHLIFLSLLCIYPLVGLIPNVSFGLRSKTELYIFAIIYGINFGSCTSYSRSVFAYLVPIGKESEMFAIFEVTDKGSSWIGPLVVAIISNHFSIRWGLFYTLFFFAIPIPLLIYTVDLEKGMKQAGRWKSVRSKDETNNEEKQDNDNRNKGATDIVMIEAQSINTVQVH